MQCLSPSLLGLNVTTCLSSCPVGRLLSLKSWFWKLEKENCTSAKNPCDILVKKHVFLEEIPVSSCSFKAKWFWKFFCHQGYFSSVALGYHQYILVLEKLFGF